jgi:hypothetical protein
LLQLGTAADTLGRSQECYKTLCSLQTSSPTTNNYMAQNVSSVKVGKPWSRPTLTELKNSPGKGSS